MYDSIQKSIIMANEAIARIEMPSDKDLVSQAPSEIEKQ